MVCKFKSIFLFLVLLLCFSVVLCFKDEYENKNEYEKKVDESEKKLPTTNHDDVVVGGLADDEEQSGDDEKKSDEGGKKSDDGEKKSDDKPALFEKTIGIKFSTKGLDDLIVLAQSFLAWKASLFSALFSSISPCMKKEKNGSGGSESEEKKDEQKKEEPKKEDTRRLQSIEESTEEEKSNENLAGMEARFDIGLARGNANLGFGTLESFIEKLNELVNASIEGPQAFREKFNEFFGTNFNLGNYITQHDEINESKEEVGDVKEDQINALRETVFSSLHQDFQLLSMLLPPLQNNDD